MSGLANTMHRTERGTRRMSWKVRMLRTMDLDSVPSGFSTRVSERTGMKADERAPSAMSLRRLLGTAKVRLMTSAAPLAPKIAVTTAVRAKPRILETIVHIMTTKVETVLFPMLVSLSIMNPRRRPSNDGGNRL